MSFPYKIIDLTHPLSGTTPTWDGGCGFQHMTVSDYASCSSEVKFKVNKIDMPAGLGTHIDAPAHCIPGGKTVDKLDLNDTCAPCIVVDVSRQSHEFYIVPPETIHTFEQTYGKIAAGSFIIIRTGWDKYWNMPEKYRNDLQFPSIARDTALLLLERDVVGLGIDTLSPDTPASGYPVHQLFLGAGKYLVENVANSNKLPPLGSFSLALPIAIEGGTEAPVRLIGLVNHKNWDS